MKNVSLMFQEAEEDRVSTEVCGKKKKKKKEVCG